MHLGRRDGWATLFVMGAVALWALWASGAALESVSTRVVGAAVFILGFMACTSDQSQMTVLYGVGGRRQAPIAYVVFASVLGAGALVAGVITLVGGSEAMLAVLVGTMLTLSVIATVRHAFSNAEHTDRMGERSSA